MSATKKQLDAYRRRLARISEKNHPGAHLTVECLNAVVTYYSVEDEAERDGTLVAFGYRIGEGLLGPKLCLDITVCDDCVHRRGRCGDEYEHTIVDATVVEIVRNGDRESVPA